MHFFVFSGVAFTGPALLCIKVNDDDDDDDDDAFSVPHFAVVQLGLAFSDNIRPAFSGPAISGSAFSASPREIL